MSTKAMSSLPDRERSELLGGLATLMRATGNTVQSLQSLTRMYPQHGRVLRHAERLAQQGGDLEQLLVQIGLLRASEAHWLAADFASGQSVDALQGLSDDLQQRQHSMKRLRVRLWAASLLLLIISLLVAGLALVQHGNAALPALLGEFTIAVLQLAALIVVLAQLLLVSRWQWLTWAWQLGLQRTRLAQTLFEACWLQALVRLLHSGQDAQAALQVLASLMPVRAYQDRMAACISAAQRGTALADMLREQGLPISSSTWQLLRSGEHSGALERALQRRLQDQHAQLAEWQEAAVTWLPRIYYLVVLSVAGRLFGML